MHKVSDRFAETYLLSMSVIFREHFCGDIRNKYSIYVCVNVCKKERISVIHIVLHLWCAPGTVFLSTPVPWLKCFSSFVVIVFFFFVLYCLHFCLSLAIWNDCANSIESKYYWNKHTFPCGICLANKVDDHTDFRAWLVGYIMCVLGRGFVHIWVD